MNGNGPSNENPELKRALDSIFSESPPEWIAVNMASLDQPPNPNIVYAGSFNPLHEGHLEIAHIATNRLQHAVWFEISIQNAEKAALSRGQLNERIAQKFDSHGLLITRAATFVEKANLFPGCVFLVGADTISRIGDERFYESDSAKRVAAIGEIEKNGCRFLVFARKEGNKVLSQSNLKLLPELNRLCEFVSEDDFLMDISSTELRGSRAKNEN